MRSICTITIFFVFSMLSLTGCGDRDNNPQTISTEQSANNMKKKEVPTVNTMLETNTSFVCPMHPSVFSDHAENCPICGMYLQKKEVSSTTVAIETNKSSKLASIDIIQSKKMVKEIKNDKKNVQKVISKSNPYLAIQYKKKKKREDMDQNNSNYPIVESIYIHNTVRVQPIEPLTSDLNKDEREFYVCPMHPTIVSHHKDNCPICGMHLVKQKKQNGSTHEQNVLRLPSGVVQKIGVKTTVVVRGRLRKSLTTAGNIVYNKDRLIDITSRADGWVENLSLRRAGLLVKQGELLMEMYAPRYIKVQKKFLQAQKIDHSAGQLKKYTQRDETVPSRETLRYLQVPESAINELVRKGSIRQRIPIYSPQYGEVVQLNVKKHSYVYDGQSMLIIADLSSVWVEVNIFQHQLEWLRRNQEAEIVVDILHGELLKGRVDFIAPSLDARTHTVKVRVLVANPNYILRPNMYAQVTIFDDPQKDILKIPRQALIVTGNRSSVIKALGNGLFMPIDVITGLYSSGEVEIKSGLNEGDLIVTSGQFLIDSEANLRASFRRLRHMHKNIPSKHIEDKHLDAQE